MLRSNRIPIIWLGWGCRPDGLDLPPNVLHSGTYSGDGLNLCDPHPKRAYRILEAGSWGSQVIDELPVEPGDVHVWKSRLGITTILSGGVNLDRCVMSTLQDASFLGYDCILVDDCSATVHPVVRDAALSSDDQAVAWLRDHIDVDRRGIAKHVKGANDGSDRRTAVAAPFAVAYPHRTPGAGART